MQPNPCSLLPLFPSVLPELQFRPAEHPSAERLQQQHTGDLPEAPPPPRPSPSLQLGVMGLDALRLQVTYGLFILAFYTSIKIWVFSYTSNI